MRAIGLGIGVLAAAVVCGAGARAAEAKPGGIIIPPMEVELGHSVTGTADGGSLEATQLMVGVSWASLWPRDTPVDLSIGLIVNTYAAPASVVQARGVESVEPASDTDAGTYVDVAVRMARGRHWRTWVGARGEVIDQGEQNALGVAARASMELWAPALAGESDGNGFAAVVGTVALSAWAEIGLREQPRGAASFTAAGLGVRVPFLIAVVGG